MGASEKTMTINGELSFDEVKEIFCKRQEEDQYYYGSDPYNGSFSTFSGIKNCYQSFDNYNDAISYILDRSEKWGEALAVKYKESNNEVKWLVGGWAAE